MRELAFFANNFLVCFLDTRTIPVRVLTAVCVQLEFTATLICMLVRNFFKSKKIDFRSDMTVRLC
jgi:hypothetical protein